MALMLSIAIPHQAATPTPEPVNLAAVVYALRTAPPKVLVEYLMGPVAFKALEPKIQGESHWTCGENNPRSSAAGLGQTLYTRGREQYLNSIGFTWDEVRGPDCLADVILIKHLYDSCGLGDWTPPYDRCYWP